MLFGTNAECYCLCRLAHEVMERQHYETNPGPIRLVQHGKCIERHPWFECALYNVWHCAGFVVERVECGAKALSRIQSDDKRPDQIQNLLFSLWLSYNFLNVRIVHITDISALLFVNFSIEKWNILPFITMIRWYILFNWKTMKKLKTFTLPANVGSVRCKMIVLTHPIWNLAVGRHRERARERESFVSPCESFLSQFSRPILFSRHQSLAIHSPKSTGRLFWAMHRQSTFHSIFSSSVCQKIAFSVTQCVKD